jgi:chromatin segregation and condensation protein Rec8/ScpA/Scc1 (kleisin family)
MRSRDFLMTTGKLFYPPRDVVPETMKMCIKNMCGELEKLLKPVALIKAEIISLKEKIHEVLSKLGKSPIEFTHIKEGKSKGEVVVLFLAILHLIKDKLVHVEQGGHFNEIIVAKKDKTA